MNFDTFVNFLALSSRDIIVDDCSKLLANELIIIRFLVVFVERFIFVRNCFIRFLFDSLILIMSLSFRVARFVFGITTMFILRKLFVFEKIDCVENSIFSIFSIFSMFSMSSFSSFFFSLCIVAINFVLLIEQKKKVISMTSAMSLAKVSSLNFTT